MDPLGGTQLPFYTLRSQAVVQGCSGPLIHVQQSILDPPRQLQQQRVRPHGIINAARPPPLGQLRPAAGSPRSCCSRCTRPERLPAVSCTFACLARPACTPAAACCPRACCLGCTSQGHCFAPWRAGRGAAAVLLQAAPARCCCIQRADECKAVLGRAVERKDSPVLSIAGPPAVQHQDAGSN